MTKFKKAVAALFCIAAAGCTGGKVSTDPNDYGPVQLRCEHQVNPGVIDTPQPRLSWVNDLHEQAAYQILVATSEEKLKEGVADVWDSRKVRSSDSHLISYKGRELESMTDYFWTVRTWDRNGIASKWSAIGKWTTGMMHGSDWQAQWIGAPWQEDIRGKDFFTAPMFRKEFEVRKDLASAKAFVTGLGYFEMRLNGEKVGDDYLVPGLTDYTNRPYLPDNPRVPLASEVTGHRVLYLCYDITAQVQEGGNAVGITLGNGYFHSNPPENFNENFGVPRLICQILLEYEDGSTETVCSDTSWKAAESPTFYNNLYRGEAYDANKEMKGWDKAGFDDTAWQNAVPRSAPDGKLTANMGPTDKVLERLTPISFERLEDGSYAADFGKMISGWLRIEGMEGKKGDILSIEHISEYPSPRCEYILSGEGDESFSPRFTWYVFDKVIIKGLKNLKPEQIVAESVGSDVGISSVFECGNPLFNQINTIWRQSQIDNMHSAVATDCPHRERLPYTGDGQIAMKTVLYNFDAASFYNKWLTDILFSQNPETGYVPNGAPFEPCCGGGPAWGAAICIMPWEYYLHYGDRRMLQASLEGMGRFVDFYCTWKREDGTFLMEMAKPNGESCEWYNLGDWVSPFGLPDKSLVHTFVFWQCADHTAKAAEVLGNRKMARKYSALAKEVRDAFHKAYYNKEEKSYGDYGSNVFALHMGVPEDRLEDVRAALRHELEVKYNKHLNTGLIASRYIFETLSLNGMGDLAYDILNQRDFPSFGWWIEQGATTTWEQWDCENSRNHPMMGGGLTWFYRILAGVDADPIEPGFRHTIIKPMPVEALDDVFYSMETPYGKLSSWVRHKDGKVSMEVTVPYGCHATVYVPKSLEAVRNAPLSDDSYTIRKVGSGIWEF